ncbi:MAG: tetratricopeptide repeat-containing serine/threonine protein kinase [Acidobacteria bacterium]|nr:tetratricopeptide repeat-containing serine/threonine protein kinase [Acidobacteriota bacterium]
MTSEPAQCLSHYLLLEKIGEGGMGVVWKAQDTVLHRIVAIKVLPADTALDERRRRMFLEEARLASSVSDARVAQVYELGRQGSLDFIVMEYVEGQPLSQILHGRPLPSEKVASLGEQVARALSRTHRKGLLHRDLKPANILVTPEGEVKVVDFGLASLYSQSDSSLSTQPEDPPTPGSAKSGSDRHGLAGTLAYMSPEQVKGITLDPRSDVFSLGAVLYEMTTGQRPFSGANRGETLREVLRANPVPVHERVPKVPLDLDRIIAKALARQREERYQTMEDLAVDLKRLGRELESGLSHSYDAVAVPWARTRRRRLLAGIGAAFLLSIVGAWLAGFWPSLPRQPMPVSGSTILIVPLEVRGQLEDAKYMGRTFAEVLATNLAPARNLKILPVPAKGLDEHSDLLAPSRSARAVGAGRLLTGSLTRRGKAIEASLNLVDTVESRILWGVQKGASEDQLTDLTSTLARVLGEQLGADFPRLYDVPEENPGGVELAASPWTTEALEAFRRSDWTAFLQATRKLVVAFPNEPDAYALHSDALMKTYENRPTPANRKALEDAIASLCRVDLNHYYCLSKPAYLLGRDGDSRGAIRRLSELLLRKDLAPAARSYVLGLRGQAERIAGDTDAALGDLEEAVRISPMRAGLLWKLGETLRSVGRYEEALLRIRQAAAVNPSNPVIQSTMGLTLANLDRAEEGLKPSAKACELSHSQPLCAGYAIALQRAGRTQQAAEVYRLAAALTEDSDGMYNLACYMALTGDRSEAIRLLRRAVDLGDVDSYIERDPDLATLRGDPGFDAIVAEVSGRLRPRRP